MRSMFSKKALFIVAVNVLVAVAAAVLLDNSAGWLAPDRDDAGFLVGDMLPFFQFMAFAVFLDHLMWALARHRAESRADARVPRLALQIASFLIYVVLLAASINLVFHQSLTAILGASGVIGLVLGLALRGLVADVFSGIALQMDRSLSLGDWLDFQHRGRDISGKMLEISWRTVVFADRGENIVLVPNGEFASVSVTNRSRPTRLSEYGASVDLGAEHDEVRIRAVLLSALNKVVLEGAIAAHPAPYVRIASFKEGVVTFRMLYCLDVGAISPVKVNHLVLVSAVQSLKAAGIPLARVQHTDVNPPYTVDMHHLDRPETRLAMLASNRFLSMLPPADLAVIAAEVVSLRLPAGHQLLHAGDPGDSMFAVTEGSLDVTIPTPEGQLSVGRLWPGDCLGEMSLFTGAPRSADVRTTEPTVLFEVRKDTMAKIFADNPALVERISDLIAARNKATESALARTAPIASGADETISLIASIRRFFRL